MFKNNFAYCDLLVEFKVNSEYCFIFVNDVNVDSLYFLNSPIDLKAECFVVLLLHLN